MKLLKACVCVILLTSLVGAGADQSQEEALKAQAVKAVPSKPYSKDLADVTPNPLIGDWEGTCRSADGSRSKQIYAQVINWGKDGWQMNVLAVWDKRHRPIVLKGKAVEEGKPIQLSATVDWGEAKGTTWTAELTKEALKGSIKGEETGTFELKRVARLSPTLGAKPPAGAIVLLGPETKDLSAWLHPPQRKKPEQPCKWKLLPGGVMQCVRGTGSVITKKKFADIRAHIEFRTTYEPDKRGQARGNSGVYFQGRYEIQVLDSYGLEGRDNECGGIYKVSKPLANMCAPPAQWQTYDVVFRADGEGSAFITALHNGVLIHDKVECSKATTAAMKGGEKGTGGIYLQDHGHPIEYRNIWVVELKD